jgi:hypothetical protein
MLRHNGCSFSCLACRSNEGVELNFFSLNAKVSNGVAVRDQKDQQGFKPWQLNRSALAEMYIPGVQALLIL